MIRLSFFLSLRSSSEISAALFSIVFYAWFEF